MIGKTAKRLRQPSKFARLYVAAQVQQFAPPRRRQVLEPRVPVAQRLEPTAHNGLVAGSSPAGPTNLLCLVEETLKAGRQVGCRPAAAASTII